MNDPLLQFRSEFPILERTTYLVSNSLGAMPRGVPERLAEYVDQWAELGVRAWAKGWWELPVSAGNEIVPVSLQSTPIKVDLAESASIQAMYRSTGKVDAVICAAGQAKFAPLAQLSDEDFRFCLDNKLMGQVNLVRFGFEHVGDRGSFTLTTGILARSPMPGSAAISLGQCRHRRLRQGGRTGSAAWHSRKRREPAVGV